MKLHCNCCDGIYNSFDVHFTSACDNKCAHCIDHKFSNLGIIKPDIYKIADQIIQYKDKIEDVLFLGGEPCLFLEDLLKCIKILKEKTNLKLYVTTAVPKTCFDNKLLFEELIDLLDGINLSVQHHNEAIADQIRNTKSTYDRQTFYKSLPQKNKIRLNLNIVKPFLFTKKDITECINYYDSMKFNSIKLSEIQHGTDVFVSFCDTFRIKMKSPYSYGCQSYLPITKIFPGVSTSILLKRSCFICEETLRASFEDGVKAVSKIFTKPKNSYGVVYENGFLSKGWI